MGNIPVLSLYTMSSLQGTKGPCIGSMARAKCWRLSRDMQMVQFGRAGPVQDMATWCSAAICPLAADLARRRAMAFKRLAFSASPIGARLVDKSVCEPMSNKIGSHCRWASDYGPTGETGRALICR